MKSKMSIAVLFCFICYEIQAQIIDRLLYPPKQYTVLKTEGNFLIDGRDNEREWGHATWTNLFSDIVTGDRVDFDKETKAKMLWNEDFLYIFISLDESNIWASLKEHDSSVYQDNALEIFIDPDGDTHNYFEIQFNAYGTIWDLYLDKPYRNGGKPLSSWDLKGLQKAVYIDGTLNNPQDIDRNWSIELAIPINSISMSRNKKLENGVIWRMNFSRVDWDLDVIEGVYHRKRNNTGRLQKEQYTVWSPQGIINLHYPERYGYILFSDKLVSSDNFFDKALNSRLLLWKFYYLQQKFKKERGYYAKNFDQLASLFPRDVNSADQNKIYVSGSEHQFWIETYSTSLKKWLALNEEGKMQEYLNKDFK